MWVDLHCHSVHSDGSESASSVAARAARRGVELLCLTDHDSCEGYAATVGACRHVMRGLELSCIEGGRTVHILVYDVARDDERWGRMEESLARMRARRKDRIREIAAELARLGMPIDIDAIIAAAGERSVGRPDVARALVRSGAVRSMDEAFERYLGDGKVADVPVGKISVAEGLALAGDAGGKMSLAHPHTLGDISEALVTRYRDHGLEGLECYYGTYTSRQRKRWLDVARKLDLVVTAGSDFHGRFTPQIPEPGISLPEPQAARLCQWLEL